MVNFTYVYAALARTHTLRILHITHTHIACTPDSQLSNERQQNKNNKHERILDEQLMIITHVHHGCDTKSMPKTKQKNQPQDTLIYGTISQITIYVVIIIADGISVGTYLPILIMILWFFLYLLLVTNILILYCDIILFVYAYTFETLQQIQRFVCN